MAQDLKNNDSYAYLAEKYFNQPVDNSFLHTKATIKILVKDFVLKERGSGYNRSVKEKIKIFKMNAKLIDWNFAVVDTDISLKQAIIDISDMPVSEIKELESLGIDFNVADSNGYINNRTNFILTSISHKNIELTKYLIEEYKVDLNKNLKLFGAYIRDSSFKDYTEIYGEDFYNKNKTAMLETDSYNHSHLIRKMIRKLKSEHLEMDEKERLFALIKVAYKTLNENYKNVKNDDDIDAKNRSIVQSVVELLNSDMEDLYFFLNSGITSKIEDLDGVLLKGLEKTEDQYSKVATNKKNTLEDNTTFSERLVKDNKVPLFLYAIIMNNNKELLTFILSNDEYKNQYDKFRKDDNFLWGFNAVLSYNEIAGNKNSVFLDKFDYTLLSEKNTSPIAVELDLLNKKDKNGTPWLKILIDLGLVIHKKGIFNQLYKENIELFNSKDNYGKTLLDYATESIVTNIHNPNIR